jgi:hypothetical protein
LLLVHRQAPRLCGFPRDTKPHARCRSALVPRAPSRCKCGLREYKRKSSRGGRGSGFARLRRGQAAVNVRSFSRLQVPISFAPCASPSSPSVRLSTRYQACMLESLVYTDLIIAEGVMTFSNCRKVSLCFRPRQLQIIACDLPRLIGQA